MWVKSFTGSKGAFALVAGAMTWEGMPEITKVAPSESAWATAAEPTMPLAPGPVLHQDALRESIAEMLGKHTPDEVGASSRRPWHYDAYRLARRSGQNRL